MCAFRSRTGRNAVDIALPKLVKGKGTAKRGQCKQDDSVVNPGALMPSVEDGRLRKLLQMIQSERLGRIPDWASKFNLSHSHLQHLFKRATGVCLGRVLHEQRLQRAVRLLENSTMSVKEIANAVGYEHTSSFTRAFERRFAQGPRRYRLENGGGHKTLRNNGVRLDEELAANEDEDQLDKQKQN